VALAAQVVEAMTTQGFFYVINHGYTLEEANKMFAVGNLTFDGVPDEEKKLYMGDPVQTGSYEGYKPLQFWVIDQLAC
jgi:isopenicillin N synthase-like dioxygenase